MNIYERFPNVFIDAKDTDGNRLIGIKLETTLSELFDAYSEIVHYIDGEVIIALENLIRRRIKMMEKNKEKPKLPDGRPIPSALDIVKQHEQELMHIGIKAYYEIYGDSNGAVDVKSAINAKKGKSGLFMDMENKLTEHLIKYYELEDYEISDALKGVKEHIDALSSF